MSHSVRNQVSAVAALAIGMMGASIFAQQPQPGQPIYAYAGDGLTLNVLRLDEAGGTLAGEIVSGNNVYPFTAQITEADGTEAIRGSFVVNGTPFPFNARQNDDESVTFSTGAKTYRLLPRNPNPPVNPPQPPGPVPQPPPVNPPQPPQPPASDPNVDNPLNPRPPVPPVQQDPNNPLNVGPGPAPVNPPPRTNVAPAGAPETLALRRAEFPDVNMGNVVAYTIMVPQDWKTEGRIEWSQNATPFPQQILNVTTPEGGLLFRNPMMYFSYVEANPIPGMPNIPPQGTPLPADIGQWYVQLAEQTHSANPNREFHNIRLVSNRRDNAAEQAYREAGRQMGANTQNDDYRIHHLVLSYDRNGVPYREELTLMHNIFQPYANQNIRSVDWQAQVQYSVAAPVAVFDKLGPQLRAAYSTYMPTPKWFTQSQLLLMDLSQQRIRDFAAAIRDRAAIYDQISQSQVDTFNKRMASMDKDQNQRVNSIYEVDDFRDTDGSMVKLSFHYKHTYSNGKGGYIQTNSTLNKPGSEYTEIFPHQFR